MHFPRNSCEAQQNWNQIVQFAEERALKEFTHFDFSDPKLILAMKSSIVYYTCGIMHDVFKYLDIRSMVMVGYGQYELLSDDINGRGHLDASPIIAIYSRTPIWINGLNSTTTIDVHLFDVIGLDLSNDHTHDSQWLHDVSWRRNSNGDCMFMNEWSRNHHINLLIAVRYVRMWYLAFVAAKEHGLKRIGKVEVGDWRKGFTVSHGKDLFEYGLNNVVFYMLGYGTAAFDAEFPGIKLVDAPPITLTGAATDIL